MSILNLYLQDKSLSILFHDYWQIDDNFRFTLSAKHILQKHNIKSASSLDRLIQQAGKVTLSNDQYRCQRCGSHHFWYTRKQFNYTIKRLGSFCCQQCKKETLINNTKTVLNKLHPYFQKYDQVYKLNTDKTTNYNQILQSLNFLELVYLFVIHKNIKTTYPGKLGPLVFPRFMHEEFYKENRVVQSLINKNLLSHTMGEPIYEDLYSLYFYYKEYKTLPPIEELDEQFKLYEKYTIFKKCTQSFFHLIFIPIGFSSGHFSKLILEHINNYIFNFKDIEYLENFLQKKRKSEIHHLVRSITYIKNFKLKSNLPSVQERFIQLKDKYNLRQIYAHLSKAAHTSFYVLDNYTDARRLYIKNCVFTNSFISKKNNTTYNKILPNNLRKSHVITFLEDRYSLKDQWLDLPVNDFIKHLIIAINNDNTNNYTFNNPLKKTPNHT